MELQDLKGLQWTAGAGQPDGGHPTWYRVYDRVAEAGKRIWCSLADGGYDQWIAEADALVARYGPRSLYLLFPVMEEAQGADLIRHAERCWHA